MSPGIWGCPPDWLCRMWEGGVELIRHWKGLLPALTHHSISQMGKLRPKELSSSQQQASGSELLVCSFHCTKWLPCRHHCLAKIVLNVFLPHLSLWWILMLKLLKLPNHASKPGKTSPHMTAHIYAFAPHSSARIQLLSRWGTPGLQG